VTSSSARLLLCLLLLLLPMTVSAEARVGDRAPDFVLEDAAGELVSLKDFHGKPLVLHFWASWCPYCEKLQPGLQALADARAAQGLVLLGISFREDEKVAPQAVLESRGLRFKTLVDGDEVADMYGVRGTPTTVFIDRDGRVVGMTHSSDPADAVLTRLVDKIAR